MFRIFLLSLLLAAAAGGVAGAGGAPFTAATVADVSILPGWKTERGTRMAALRIVLAPGWKTYWRAPGDAGIPPRFDWTGSRNLRGVTFHWPTPNVYEQNRMRTLGYKEELVLPMELVPMRAGEDIDLRAQVELGVCYDVCMPMQVTVAAELQGAGQTDARIRAAISDRPFTEAEAGVGSVRCAIEPIRDGMRVTATVPIHSLGPREIAVFEHPDQTVWVSEASTIRQGDVLTVVSDMVPPSGRPFAIDRSQIRITLLGNGQAVDIRGCTG